jgi:two-component system cell cycle response regulator
MSKSEIFSRLIETGSMPAPSPVVHEIVKQYRDSSPALGLIVRSIESDPELCSYLLEYTNSISLSGNNIISVSDSATKLGAETSLRLLLCFSILTRTKHGSCTLFSHQRFWSQSLARAVAARALASRIGHNDPDQLFTCGLLAHIGRLAFASLFPEDYSAILTKQLDWESQLQKEFEVFGLSHEELSSSFFQYWGLPDDCGRAVHFHHEIEQPFIADNAVTLIRTILLFADTIAQICLLEMPVQDRIAAAEESAAAFGLEKDEFADIFDEIVKNWQRWGYVFKIPTQDCPTYRTLKETDQMSNFSSDLSFKRESFKILVTDDDPMTLLSLSRLLNGTGSTVFTADNGEDGLKLALEKQPHMLITDWRMPKMNGIDLCRALRENTSTRHIYIIMLTGKESDDELVQAFEAGADDFMVKPFTPKVLEARIRSGERIIGYQQLIHRDREVIQQYADLLASANLKLQNMAMTDVLTGLPNRRSALNRLKDAVAESLRHKEPLCCIMIDIDHFKKVNDKYGHDVGDLVLKDIALIFNSSARSYDMVSRIGGEEFLVICDRSSLAEAGLLAERLRAAVELHRVIHNDIPIQTTISLGVAAWSDSMSDGEEMTKAADLALYQAKQKGRNKVVVNKETSL